MKNGRRREGRLIEIVTRVEIETITVIVTMIATVAVTVDVIVIETVIEIVIGTPRLFYCVI